MKVYISKPSKSAQNKRIIIRVILIIVGLLILIGITTMVSVIILRCKCVDDPIIENCKEPSQDQCTHVSIPNGKLRGRKLYSPRKVPFYAFQQIPYAKPPTGQLRFKPPEPAENWNGVLDATKNSKTCFQFKNVFNVSDWKDSQTEDCLFLNVYTPVCPTSGSSLAVMFYIYGGGYLSGSASYEIIGPDLFMENNIIIVTFNHRLGPLGFLSTGDEVLPGNYGMKDQVLALKWVNQNIKYFGGDPNKVTIYGQSSGGSAVGLHLMSKLSKGLFRGAICQSASSLSTWSYQGDYKEIAYGIAQNLDSNFNMNATSEELLEFLRSFPAAEVNAATRRFPRKFLDEMYVQGFIFTPVIEPPEHENAFITESMYTALKKGHFNKVPLLIGMVSEEAINKFEQMPLADVINLWKEIAIELDENPSILVHENMHITDERMKRQIGEEIHKLYTDGPFSNDLGKAAKFFSDTTFSRAVIRHAQLQSYFGDVFFYQFSYYSPIIEERPNFRDAYRVGHSDDNPFLWVFNKHNIFNEAKQPMDILTSDRFRTLYANFITYLNPTPNKTELFNNTIWPTVKPDNFLYLNINETLSIEKDPRNDTYRKWVELYEGLAVKPLNTF